VIRRRRDGQRGQGVVEFALLVPVFMLILLAMLEFGFLFDHTLTIQYASREGARVGSALVNGGGTLGCPSSPTVSPNADTVDPLIIAAVTRVLKSPGSRVDIAQVPTIRIYKANASGDELGPVNVWTYSAGATAVVDGVTLTLNYSFSSALSTPPWPACIRFNGGASPDSIGVSLTYTYQFQTALGNVLRFFGGSGFSTVTVSDRTVMAMNPSN
jgi:hypothetical protein